MENTISKRSPLFTIAGIGDIMPGGILDGEAGCFINEKVITVLKEADIRVGTLETAVGNEPTFYDEKMSRRADVIYVKDDALKRLVELDINIVSLANNHFFDLGPEGAMHAIELLDSLGIQHCGAGHNLEEAGKPVVFKKNGKSVAFLAFCDWRDETVGWCPFATDTNPGVNPLFDNYVVEQITKYKVQYDFVVVIAHWGKEHTFVTTRPVYELAKKMVSAGADVILGGHTHRIQPVVTTKAAVIAYSMGNFFFPDRLIVKPRSTYYPDIPLDIRSLPTTSEYPFVEQVTLKLWKPLARIGEIVTIGLHPRRKSVDLKFVKLDEANTLQAYSLPFSTKLIMLWQKVWLTFLPYPQYASAFVSLKSIVKRLIHRR